AGSKSALDAPSQEDLTAQRIAVGIDELDRDPRIAAHAGARAVRERMRGLLGDPDRRARSHAGDGLDVLHERMNVLVDVVSEDHLYVHTPEGYRPLEVAPRPGRVFAVGCG